MQKKSKVWTVIGIIMLVGFIGFYIFRTVFDLISLGNAVEVDSYNLNVINGKSITGYFFDAEGSDYENPLISMKHTINGLIPIGTEHYFLIYNDSETKALYVRADEDFLIDFYKELDASTTNGVPKGVKLTGRIRELDSDMKHELYDFNYALADYGINVITDGNEVLYLDLTTKFQSILRILVALSLTIAVVSFLIVAKRNTYPNNQGLNNILGVLAVIFLVAGLCGMIYTLTFLF
ncbi:MAG: hypothetical protein K6E47_16000 [Lachnospiraceae bacterium]|nr:hypothetical protein [Lachnospiraceae bacterium]